MPQAYGDDVRSWVQTYYGQVLKSSADLKTNACCVESPPEWLREPLARIHPQVSERFYGCGFPVPEALDGRTLVDLGCGSGRDVFLLAQLVGAKGRVHGVDMTQAQLDVARRHRDYHAEQFGYSASNVDFIKGNIRTISAD